MTVYDIIAEPLIANKMISKGRELDDRVKELGAMVKLNLQHLKRYPHAFSGGQRQRIGIARALATNPKFIVADESVSALDVSVQAQVINLLKELQQQLQVAYMFIAHDLGVVQHISDRVAVMYLGRIVEMAETNSLFETPRHPYTEALLSAVPKPDPKKKTDRILLTGEVPSPANPPSGCYFHPRCRYAQDICKEQRPPFDEVTPGHYAACHFSKEFQLGGVE
jgi:peptide/nickel transport system ATP-binding protein